MGGFEAFVGLAGAGLVVGILLWLLGTALVIFVSYLILKTAVKNGTIAAHREMNRPQQQYPYQQ